VLGNIIFVKIIHTYDKNGIEFPENPSIYSPKVKSHRVPSICINFLPLKFQKIILRLFKILKLKDAFYLASLTIIL